MKFTWNKDKATLLLSIPEVSIPRKVFEYATAHGFHVKPELHLTILSFQNGKKLVQGNTPFRNEIPMLAESFIWAIDYLPEYHVLERTIPEFIFNEHVRTPRHTRRSIIQKVVVPDLSAFFHQLEKATNISFEVPVAHITLFTWSDYEPEQGSGIALNSQADFDKYLRETLMV